jgi:hypothetical protein
MQLNFKNIKREIVEPKIYAILVKSLRGFLLHVGVYFSLDDAYADAKEKLELSAPYEGTDLVIMETWNSMSLREAIFQSINPDKRGEWFVLTPDNIKNKDYPADLPEEVIKALDIIKVQDSSPEELQEPEKVEVEVKAEEQHEPMAVTSEDLLKEVHIVKDSLIKQIIENNDENTLIAADSIFTRSEKRYILHEIKKRVVAKK